MFCARCGSPMQPDAQVCSHCGRRVGDPISAIAQSRLDRHLHTLGVLWIVIGCLFMVPALILALLGPVIGAAIESHRPIDPSLGALLLWTVEGTLVILAAGGVCVGLGLIQRRPWARIAALVLGILAVVHPPLGTALGIYTLWVLLADDGGNEYRYLTRCA